MTKFLASGGKSPPSHSPSRENPGLNRLAIFRGWLLVKRTRTFFKARGSSFYIKNKLKVKDFFFSVITRNLNWEILTKNLVTFKRWDGVKDGKS